MSLFVAFIVRRCFRLLPLSGLTVMSIALLRLPVGHLRDGQFFGVPMRPPEVIANLLLVQGLTHVESVEAPLWSLPLEMQMYLVLPLIFAFVRTRPNAYRGIALWAGACAFGWVCARFRIGEMPTYVPCFLAGVMSYKLPRPQRSWPSWLWPVVLFAITIAYLSKPSLAVGWFCCLALGLVIPQLADVPSGIVARTCHYVARYSYGIYLWHFILLWFAFVRLGALPFSAQVGLFLVLLVAVPMALYHLVESPMIRVGTNVANRLKTQSARRLWASLLLAAVVLGAIVGALRAAVAKRPTSIHPASTRSRSEGRTTL